MAEIQFQFFPVKEISSFGKIKSSDFSSENDFKSDLGKLFPHRKVFFEQQEAEALEVTLETAGPIGPDPDILISRFFNDFPQALVDIQNKYALPKIEIRGWDQPLPEPIPDNLIINPEPDETSINKISLNILETYLFHEATIKGRKPEACIITVFLDFDRIFCYLAPLGTSIEKLGKKEPVLKDYLKDKIDLQVYHPMKKIFSSIDEPINEPGPHLLSFSDSGYQVRPLKSFLFPFPYFNRQFRLEKTDSDQEIKPCVNCLACVEHCPSDIYPNYLYHNLIKGNPDEAFALNMKACIQCGKCSLVCPSNLPLFQKINLGLAAEQLEGES